VIEADLILRGARLLTLEPLKDERPRVGPAAGDVGAVNDGFVAARDGMIVATGHGRAPGPKAPWIKMSEAVS